MRCTQTMGLSEEAHEFLRENQLVEVINKDCPHCGGVLERVNKPSQRVYDNETGKIAGMFDDGPELNEYDLQDGRKAREVVQAVPWSSGPCIFLCLEIDGRKEFLWSDEDIRKA